ncbi:MAG TPA: PadR family transcriptional regulator [Acidobacteriota bacterium]|nr:PadR family transcriptional regulator [Acidobacteriota bacterium]
MIKDNTQAELKESLNQELRRGTVVLAVLSQLKSEHYGYSLKRRLEEKGLAIDEGTLYPLMRRLESQGLLTSEWRLEDARPRRYYRLSKLGSKVLDELRSDWDGLATIMGELLK